MPKQASFLRRVIKADPQSSEAPATPRPRSSKIFISYSRKDRPFVSEFNKALENHNQDAWIDWEDIPFTAEWLKEIYAGIEAADTFVFVISPDSISSDTCILELDHAVTYNKRLIPVICREVDATKVPFDIASLNWIYFYGENSFEISFQGFINALETDLAYASAVSRLLVRSLDWERKGRDRSLLLRGKDLKEAEDLLTESSSKKGPKPTQTHTAFILASRQHESSRQRKIITTVTVGLAITITLAVVSFILYRLSETRAKIADSRQLAAQALTLLDDELDLALLLSAEASRTYDTVEARSSLITALEYSPNLNVFYHGHKDIVYGLAYSPDGKILASGSSDGTLILWDTGTGKQIHSPLNKHKGAVSSVSFSPDGKRVASAGSDNTVILWDTTTGKLLGQLNAGPSEELSSESMQSVAFSPDDKWVCSGSSFGVVLLWNLQSLSSSPKRFPKDTSAVTSLAFSPDSGKLISIDENGLIVIWDVETGKQLSHILPEQLPKDAVTKEQVRLSYGLDFNLTQNLIAAGTEEGNIFLADLDSPAGSGKLLSGHTAKVTSVVFTPDGKLLASCSQDRTVIVWDAKTGERIGQPFRGHRVWISSLAFSPDGKSLASGSNDGDIIIWDLKTGSRLGTTLQAPIDDDGGLAFSPDNKVLAFVGKSNQIQLWDLIKNEPYGAPLLGSPGEIIKIAFGRNGETLASCHRNGQIMVWEIAAEKRSNPFLKWQIDKIAHAAFSPDGSLLSTSTGEDDYVSLWDVSTGQRIGNAFEGHKEMALCMSISKDNKLMASGGQDKTVLLWDIRTHQPVLKPLSASESFVFSVAFSPDTKTIAGGDEDGVIHLWNVATGNGSTIPPRGYDGFVWTLLFSPDGFVLASGDEQGTVHLWNASTGKRFGVPLKQHKERISQITFSPDSRSLASISQDGRITLWDFDVASWQARALRIANREFQAGER
jgi:WD40 repeat protein